MPMTQAVSSRRQVAVASLIMIGAIFLSRISGLARLVVFGAQFGVTAKTSAYTQAFVLPDLVNMLIGGGVIASAFIPFYTQRRAAGDVDGAFRTFSNVLTTMAMALMAICVAIALAAPLFAEVFVPSKGAGGEVLFSPEDQQWWVDMTRIMVGAQLFFVTGGLFMGVLHAHQHFWAPAIGPIVYNLFIIGGIVLLGREYGVKGAAWAVPIGAFVGQWVLQIPVMARYRVRFRPVLDLRDAGLRRVFAFMAPVILGLSIMHINMLVARALAAGVSEEGPTYFEFAFRLAMMPVGVFAMGTAMAAYPTLAAAIARGDQAEYRQTLCDSLRRVLLLTLASTALLVVAARPLVSLLFGHGEFGPENVDATASATVFFALTIVGLSVQQVLIRGFYALEDSRTPVTVGVASVALAYVLARAMAPTMGVEGICLALGIASTAGMAAMWALLARRQEAHGVFVLVLPSLWRMLGATLLCALGAWIGMRLVSSGDGEGLRAKALAAAPPVLGAALGFVAGCATFRIADVAGVARRLVRRRGE